MQHDHFIGQVQHRARLASRGEAEKVTREVLETLGERLEKGLAGHVASQLPVEIGHHLAAIQTFARFSLEGFYLRIAAHGGVELGVARFHAHVVLSVLREALSPSMVDKIRAYLPKDFHPLFDSPPEKKRLHATGHPIPVRDVMTHGVQVVGPDVSLQEAAEIMKGLNSGVLPVRDGKRLVGIVTDRDIAIRGVAAGCGSRTTPVQNVMTPEVVCCFEDEDIVSAAQEMERHQIRRLLVLNQEKQLVGIVSLGDLATHLKGTNDVLTAEVLEHISERSAASPLELASLH